MPRLPEGTLPSSVELPGETALFIVSTANVLGARSKKCRPLESAPAFLGVGQGVASTPATCITATRRDGTGRMGFSFDSAAIGAGEIAVGSRKSRKLHVSFRAVRQTGRSVSKEC
jgi:hypothetical protein